MKLNDFIEGQDVTELLGIIKYDPQAQEERALSVPTHRNKVIKFCMKSELFRTIYFKLNNKERGAWPSCISHTDEEPIQKCADIIFNHFHEDFYVSEKLDGQSASFFVDNQRIWGFNRRVFGVCSRNIHLKTPDNSKYWQSAKKYNLEKILKQQDELYSIAAEQAGPGIQGNKYNLSEVQLFVFNVNRNGERQKLEDMLDFCAVNGLSMVPIISRKYIPYEHIPTNDRATIVKWLLDYSNGKSLLYDTIREGVVFRLNSNPSISFKVRSPEFLIKHEE